MSLTDPQEAASLAENARKISGRARHRELW